MQTSAKDLSNLVGELLSDRYRVLEKIGEGGMAYVYLAEHTLMKKRVALKVMRPELLAEMELVERFQREARAAAQIDHPNVCAATDFGQIDERAFFLVMEYLEGTNLMTELEVKKRLEPRRAVDVAIQIASGLARAHELDIVHRDLKPSNVQIIAGPDGRDVVKIMDFGFALIRVESLRLTRTGVTMGTPAYMSPELARALPTDARSDLYTLGVILFEMLTGEVPFWHKSKAVLLAKHAEERAPSVYEVCDVPVPYDVAKIVARLLEKDPKNRLQTAQEVVDALRAADMTPYTPSVPGEELPAAAAAPQNSESVPEKLKHGVDELVRRMGPAQHLVARFQALPRKLQIGAVLALLFVVCIPPVVGIGVVAMLAEETEEATPDEAMVFGDEDVEPVDLSLEDEREQFLAAQKIPALLENEEPAQRVTALLERAKQEELSSSAHFNFVLAAAHWDAEQYKESIEAYASAVEREKRYAGESVIVQRVAERMAVKELDSPATSELVKVLLEHEESAEAMRAALFEVAIEGPWKARKRARDLLSETGQLEKLEEWQRVSIDLRLTGKDCERIKTLVNKLEKLGDPGALPALKKMTYRPTDGCGFFKRGDCYKCMREDLSRAINELKKKKPAEEKPDDEEGAAAEEAP